MPGGFEQQEVQTSNEAFMMTAGDVYRYKPISEEMLALSPLNDCRTLSMGR
jgi:hypothetical protein